MLSFLFYFDIAIDDGLNNEVVVDVVWLFEECKCIDGIVIFWCLFKWLCKKDLRILMFVGKLK